MKLLLAIGCITILSGCVTDKAYSVAKTIYIGGKKVVIQNADMLDEDTLRKLESLDDYATKYDKGRSVVKKSSEASMDANSTSKMKR